MTWTRPNVEDCLVYSWLLRRPNVPARLAHALATARARTPEEIRATMRQFVSESLADARVIDERELRDALIETALDRVDWDQLVVDYLERPWPERPKGK